MVINDPRVSFGNGSAGIRFVCFRCGICCRRYQAYLSLAEARLIAGKLGISWEEWLNNYADVRWPGERSLLIRQKNGACIFLEQFSPVLTSCAIHCFRPLACSGWNQGSFRVECRQGLSWYWHLEVAESGELVGLVENLAGFEMFLQSLNEAS